MIIDESAAKLGTVEDEYDSESKTCDIYANVHYKIVYSEMGFTQNLQKYIVKMEKSAEKTKWTFNRSQETDKQSFHVGVSFQFVSLD